MTDAGNQIRNSPAMSPAFGFPNSRIYAGLIHVYTALWMPYRMLAHVIGRNAAAAVILRIRRDVRLFDRSSSVQSGTVSPAAAAVTGSFPGKAAAENRTGQAAQSSPQNRSAAVCFSFIMARFVSGMPAESRMFQITVPLTGLPDRVLVLCHDGIGVI